jgi:hypothetical protein
MGENIKVVWAKFSTLSWAVLVMSTIVWHIQTRPHLELKNRPRFVQDKLLINSAMYNSMLLNVPN